ncbi:MAG: type II toxin-antitoxin system VapC family toxin [Thermomicrobiales bacterium]
MVKGLLDTCVVSEMLNPRGNENVVATVGQIDDAHLFLSVLTIGEIAKGLHRLADGRRRSAIEFWLATVQSAYEERILPIDLRVAQRWGELSAHARDHGVALPVVDGLIAATALVHGLTVVTRNVRDFVDTGVPLIDPWQETV